MIAEAVLHSTPVHPRAPKSRLLSRRGALASGFASALVLAGCGAQKPPPPQPSAGVEVPPPAPPAPQARSLRLMGWPFRPDLLRERLAVFEDEHPGLAITHERALRDYGTRASQALAASPSVDMVQVREGLAGVWGDSGALRALGDTIQWSGPLDDMWPHARAAVTHGGQVMGLPYYSDVMVLAYNRSLLERVGAPVPATLEQLSDVCLAAARQRVVEFPISLNLSPKAFANLPWWALVYAGGGSLQGSDGPDPAAVAVLEWLRGAIAIDRVVDPAFLESTYAALALQKHLFAIVGGFTMKRLHDAAPGIFAMAPVPGIIEPAGTVGWTPFYAVGANSEHPELATELARFLGGRDAGGAYGSARFWLRHEGLLPAYPEVLRDQQLVGEISPWLDLEQLDRIVPSARPLEGAWAPWFLAWEHEMQVLIQRAIFGHEEPEAALAAVRERAAALSAP